MADVVSGTPRVPATAPGETVPHAPPAERAVKMGRGEPLPIRPLPAAWNPVHILGPGMVLTALGVGIGETFQWPRMVTIFGPNVRILFLLGVTVQLFVMMEMGRYALATGESIFFGAARLHPLVMWFFWATAMLVYIWPGHVSLGAASLSVVTGIPAVWLAIGGILLIALVLTFAPVVYSVVETVLTVLIAVMVVGAAVIASFVGRFPDLVDTLTGLVGLSHWSQDPSTIFSGQWLPIIVGAIAFAGPSGMQQMWYTLYLRDKGAGMGKYAGRITSWLTGEEESMPDRGHTFDMADRQEMAKWRMWRQWNLFDAVVLFWGITMLTTIIYTVLALASTHIDPAAREAISRGQSTAALRAMATAFGQVGGGAAFVAFYLFMAVVGMKMSFGIFDAFSRGQADMTWYFMPGARRWHMSKWYYAFLYFVVGVGIITVLLGTERGPTFILDMLAFLSAFVMGAYCVLLLAVNNFVLPKAVRPNLLTNAVVAFGAVFYLSGLFYSLFVLGKIPSG
jgi:hypothetical protein